MPTKLKAASSEYEDKRLHNLEQNEEMIRKLKAELASVVQPLPSRSRKRSHLHKENTDDLVQRRNPSRRARYTPIRSPPLTRRRIRRPSLSSLESNSNDSFPEQAASKGRLLIRFTGFGSSRSADEQSEDVDVYDDEDEELLDGLPESPHKKRNYTKTRFSADQTVTEDDIARVATMVSEKRYDSVYGTSCHQCRQKTDDQKTICKSGQCFGVRGQFCGPCLRNRYGEDAQKALRDPEWACPACRGICNCSFCRKKKGRQSTGILIHHARENGFSDVNSYLQSLH